MSIVLTLNKEWPQLTNVQNFSDYSLRNSLYNAFTTLLHFKIFILYCTDCQLARAMACLSNMICLKDNGQ